MLDLLLVLTLIASGSALVFAALLSARGEEKAVEARLNLLSPAGAADRADASHTSIGLLLERLDRPALGFFSLGSRKRWGLRTKGAMALAIGLASGVAAGLVAHLALGAPAPASLVCGLAAFYLVPWMLLRLERERTEARFGDVFPDAIDIVVRMIRAGLPVTAAIRVVANEAASPVREAFAELADQILIGRPVPDALAEMGDRIGLKDVRFFAVAVSLQQRTGGNLASTLEILSEIIRKRRGMRLKARAVTAEVRLSAYVLGAIPIFVIVLFWVLDRSYLETLISDHRGRLLMGIAAFMLLLGFGVMRQMMRGVSKA
jgi:tight adherence protein B